MSCAQITIQEYILTKPYTSMNNYSTDDSSDSQVIPAQSDDGGCGGVDGVEGNASENVIEEEQESWKMSPLLQKEEIESETDVNPINNDYKVDQSQCKQSPSEYQLNKPEVLMTKENMHQTDSDLCGKGFDDTNNRGPFVSISLADYLDKLTKQSENPGKKFHKLLPREVISHFQAPKMNYSLDNKSHLSTSSVSSLSTQQFDLNNNNKDNNDDSIDEQLDNNQDDNNNNSNKTVNKNNHSKASVSMDYFNYLKKRRVFLIDRLLSRYSELIKLLNEELELTGRPPTNYLQYTHAYYEVQEAFKRIHANESTNSSNNVNSNAYKTDDSSLHITDKDQLSKCLNTIHVRGSRLQETGFMLSPRVIRKANDLVNQNREQVARKCDGYSNQIMNNSKTLNYSTKEYSQETLNSTRSAKKLQNENCIMQKFNKSLPLTFKPRFKSNLLQFNNELCTSASSPSLCDSGVLLRQTTNQSTTKPTTTTTQPQPLPPPAAAAASVTQTVTSLSSSSPLSSLSTGLLNSSQSMNLDNPTSITNEIDIQNSKQETFDIYSCKDIQKAISWLEVELNAVKNIMLANMKCANENRRNRTSRKAYRLAVKRNQETINSLQSQIRSLQIYAEKQEPLCRNSKYENASVCNSDASMRQSSLRISTSSLSSPSCSYSPSSSLMNSLVIVNEHVSSGQSTPGVQSKVYTGGKESAKFQHSPPTAAVPVNISKNTSSLIQRNCITPNFDMKNNCQTNILHSGKSRNLPITSSHSQLNISTKVNKNTEKVPKSSSTYFESNECKEMNFARDNPNPVEQTGISSCETTTDNQGTLMKDDRNDNDDGSEIYYEHLRNKEDSTSSVSSPAPKSITVGERCRTPISIERETGKYLCDIATQTENNGIYQEEIFKNESSLPGGSNNHPLLRRHQQQHVLPDTSDKTKYINNNNYEPFVTSLSMNENKYQQFKQLNEQKYNLMMHLSKSSKRPSLSSSSSWSSANSLCSINLAGHPNSTENNGYVPNIHKTLHSSLSTHNIWISPQRTLVEVDLHDSNHGTDHRNQSNGKKEVPISQHNWNNYTINKTNLYYPPSENKRQQSPVFVSGTSKPCQYYSPTQCFLNQSTQKATDYPTILSPGLTKHNIGSRVNSNTNTVTKCPISREFSNQRRLSNQSPRSIERTQLKTTLSHCYFDTENTNSSDHLWYEPREPEMTSMKPGFQ
ncbi:unnamed protein product [Trichobilharzia szidati]|nr:unnamed protein product [Trichobilharzia szidati]CAH8854924.1 unnamed protein product [Trichobilharzia szidati]